MTILDLRGKVPEPTRFSRFKRDWQSIKGVTVHRTACIFGEDVERWKGLDAHIGVTLGGQVFILQPLTLGIWHGNGLSPFTIGIEFEGNPAGFIKANGQPYYWPQGGGPHPCTPAMEYSGVELFDFLLNEFQENGAAWEGVWAHRQSSKSRESDPGVEVWQKIAMSWREKLGCPASQLEQHWGDGQPIPREWDSNSHHRFWEG
jgi:hypothetical protein